MSIIGGFDLHRQQITFEHVDTETGELRTGQIRPATRASLRQWLSEEFAGRQDVAFALEGCTGWRFVVEELQRLGMEAHVAEPADTATLKGPKKRAKTDKADARLLRELLCQRRLPESWIPPQHVLEVRNLTRLYVTLMAQRRAWEQRIHAQLYHQGVPPIAGLLTLEGRCALARADLSPSGREMTEVACRAIEALEREIDPLRARLQAIGRRQKGARALKAHYGIGNLLAAVIWAELGDCRRFRRSLQAVRFAGLDITVWSTDRRRAPGHLSRQGSPVLRWALFEAAVRAAHPRSPDYELFRKTKQRHDGKRALLTVARKVLRRCHHSLRKLGDEAWQPANEEALNAETNEEVVTTA